MTMFKNKVAAAMTVLALGVFGAGCEVAGEDAPGLEEVYTAPSGLTLRVLARGELVGDSAVDLRWNGTQSETESNDGVTLDFVMVEITIAPGGHTGWHTHPGGVQVVVAQGAITLYHAEDPCVGETFSAGQAIIEHGGVVDIARNHGDVPARVNGTFTVPHGSPFRLDQPAPPGSELCP